MKCKSRVSQRRQNGNVASVEERRSWHKRIGNGFFVVVGRSRPAGGKLARRDWQSDGIGLVWSAIHFARSASSFASSEEVLLYDRPSGGLSCLQMHLN